MLENTSSTTNFPYRQPEPPAPPDTSFELLAIEGPCHPLAVLENLLKHPGRIIHELRSGRTGQVAGGVFIVLLICLAIYGVVVGMQSGGAQLWIAPAKIALGSLVAGLICLPSLYIFLCLSGVDAHLRQTSTILLASVGLSWLLLIGFAPVAWVFSQSTDSIALMAFLHLIFWVIALTLGLRFLAKGMSVEKGRGEGNLTVWMVIYTVVCLQMMTSLRPIVGHAETFLPTEKQFFVAHVLKVMGERGGNDQ